MFNVIGHAFVMDIFSTWSVVQSIPWNVSIAIRVTGFWEKNNSNMKIFRNKKAKFVTFSMKRVTVLRKTIRIEKKGNNSLSEKFKFQRQTVEFVYNNNHFVRRIVTIFSKKMFLKHLIILLN